jgi:macrodomain Ter protein organizer (MatP/YcbG family)
VLSLYRHEFDEILSNILEHQKMSTHPEMIKDFFDYLRKSIVSWTKKTEIPCSFQPFNSLIEHYDLEKAERDVHYPSLRYEGEDVQLYGEELVAMTITGNMMDSQEFSQRIENWLDFYLSSFLETARKFEFNKLQEIGEVALEIFKTIAQRRWHLQPKDPFTLKKEEKERLLNWKLLLDRYGEETTKFIVSLVEEATSRYAEKKDEFDVQNWIMKKTRSHLKEKGIIHQYAKEHFWS